RRPDRGSDPGLARLWRLSHARGNFALRDGVSGDDLVPQIADGSTGWRPTIRNGKTGDMVSRTRMRAMLRGMAIAVCVTAWSPPGRGRAWPRECADPRARRGTHRLPDDDGARPGVLGAFRSQRDPHPRRRARD